LVVEEMQRTVVGDECRRAAVHGYGVSAIDGEPSSVQAFDEEWLEWEPPDQGSQYLLELGRIHDVDHNRNFSAVDLCLC
jgi:hypothetical protein